MTPRRKVRPLTRPCNDCPFRITGGIRLEPGRAREIAENAVAWNGESFHCHKTTHGEEDDNGNYITTGHEQQCAGAVAFAVRQGRESLIMRIGILIGAVHGTFNSRVLRSVFPSIAAMVRANPGWRTKRRAPKAAQ